jgi:hypothetical protein
LRVANSGQLHDWVENLPRQGRYVFSRTEAESISDASPQAAEATLRRLKKRGKIVSLPFPSAAGYWNTIATVLGELAEALDSGLLATGAQRVPRSDSQRPGGFWISSGNADWPMLWRWPSKGKRLVQTPLNTERDTSDAALDPRWRILVNDEVEPDL